MSGKTQNPNSHSAAQGEKQVLVSLGVFLIFGRDCDKQILICYFYSTFSNNFPKF